MLMVGELFYFLLTIVGVWSYCTPCLFFRRNPLRFSLELSFVAIDLSAQLLDVLFCGKVFRFDAAFPEQIANTFVILNMFNGNGFFTIEVAFFDAVVGCVDCRSSR